MSSIFEFEFKKPKVQNAPSYYDIRAGYPNGTIDPITYYLRPLSVGGVLSGDGILEMQKKMATVFKQYKPELFKKYFSITLDQKLLDSVTDGRYTARTMEMVMDFQKTYVYYWKNVNKQYPVLGFGAFAGYTKKELDNWYGAAIRAMRKANIEIDKDLEDLIVH